MPDQPLDYATPKPPPIGRNRWWKVALRIVAGFIAGIASGVLGTILGVVTSSWVMGFLPFLIIFGAATYFSFQKRRYGYLSGVLVASILLGAVVYSLFRYPATCGPT